ncbi:MAG: sulfurtransferase TusA family protein [Candidatus Hodarchaeales archaeon]
MAEQTNLGKDVPEKSDHVVDARGSACPGPLLETKKAIGKVPVEGVLEIWSSDPGSRNDIPAWSKFAKHEYLGFVEDDGYDRFYVIRKK